MAIDSDPLIVCKDQEAGFYGLTITRGVPFGITDGSRRHSYSKDSAHLLTPDKTFDFSAKDGASLLVSNFYIENLHDYARRLSGSGDPFNLPGDYRVSLNNPAGASLVRYLTFVWGELNHGGGILNSDLVAAEIEDGLIAALVLAADDTVADSEPYRVNPGHPGVTRAEEYILANLCNPVSRSELANLAGVSIRTLSREFVRRHGMGPMAFLKQRRLEAARKELLLAEQGEITVSDVALRYGFAQPGKFAAAYRAAFNESPSNTLHHR